MHLWVLLLPAGGTCDVPELRNVTQQTGSIVAAEGRNKIAGRFRVGAHCSEVEAGAHRDDSSPLQVVGIQPLAVPEVEPTAANHRMGPAGTLTVWRQIEAADHPGLIRAGGNEPHLVPLA